MKIIFPMGTNKYKYYYYYYYYYLLIMSESGHLTM